MSKTFLDFGIDIGTRSGVEVKTTCPQCSPRRKKKNMPCLNVNTEKGIWHCWHCDWSGSLGKGVEHRPVIAKTYRKPDFVSNSTKLPDSVVDWFASRGISQKTLIRNQIASGRIYFPQVEEERGCVMFPYMRGSECINVKYRTRDKLFRLASGAERVLYGINDIDSALIWVEGEMDKLSLEEAGYTSVVSVPDGAPAVESKNYDSKFDFMGCEELAKVSTHIIAVDNDLPGRRLEEELIRRLGREKCLVVKWPDGCKDANDVLVGHGAKTLKENIEDAQPLPIEGVYTAKDFYESILRRYRGEHQKGASTGWANVDEFYTVLPGEWTLVTGIPGHGKSEFLDALLVNLARLHGWKFGMFSPENHPVEYHTEKLIEKYTGKPFSDGPNERLNATELDTAVTFIDQHFHFQLPDRPTIDTLLEQGRQMVSQHGVRGLVIDPWNEVEHVRDGGVPETEYISLTLSKIRRFARDNGVHVWIVAHPAKLYKEKDTGDYPVPTPYDVSGSAHWRNKADNCITVYRHLKDKNKPVEIHVQKVRKKYVGGIGMAEMRYSWLCGQYTPFTGYAPVYSLHKERA
tara:strand:+ start:1315 stop:3036 length:1722 start_codon:yes stop_codon:yes gene_type:complete